MKALIRNTLILISSLLLAQSVLAAQALTDDAIAPQSYQSSEANFSAPSETGSRINADDPSEQAPSLHPQHRHSPSDNSASHAPSSSDAHPVPSATGSSQQAVPEASKSVQAQIFRLNQAFLYLEQTQATKMDRLTQRVSTLEARLEKLTHAFILLNQQLAALPINTASPLSESKAALSGSASEANHSSGASPESGVESVSTFLERISEIPSVYLIAALCFVLMILVGLYVLTARRRTKQSTGLSGSEDEYDFMGSDEAIPAKLDLARTYIDMGELDSAKSVLNEVISKGDDAQKEEARTLLERI